MSDSEFEGRLRRLRDFLERLSDRMSRALGRSAEAREPETLKELDLLTIADIDAVFGSVDWTRISDEEAEARLFRLLDQLEQLFGWTKEELRRSAERLDPEAPETVELMTSAEIEAVYDPAEHASLSRYDVELASTLASLSDDADRASSEVRALIAARCHIARARGRPAQRRAREMAAYLLGYARGLGLRSYRNREKKGPKHSSLDAVADALRLVRELEDPVVSAVWREAPRTYDALEKLSKQSSRDDRFRACRLAGLRLGRKRRKATPGRVVI